MKKLLAILLTLTLCFAIVGCGDSEESSDTSPLSKDEITDMFANADNYAGRTVKDLPVLISQVVGESDGVYQYQGYNDTDYENTLLFTSSENLELEEDDYVLLSGKVDGNYEYDTILGAENSAPLIVNASVKKADATIFNPALETLKVEKTQKQQGIEVTLNRVELAENSTRAYFTIKNNSSDKIDIYTFNSFIKQGETQYDESDISYDENTLKTEINKGIKSSGCLSFQKMKTLKETFSITLDIESYNYEFELSPFTFKVTP